VLDYHGRASRREAPASEADLALLRAHDPEALIDQIAPRPLLLMHGTEDKTLPIAEIRRFVSLARPAYAAHPERLHLEEYGGLGHHIIPTMIMQMRNWFLRYL
jgi:predicted esterase